MLSVCNIINNVAFVTVYSKGRIYVKRCSIITHTQMNAVFLQPCSIMFLLYIFIYLLAALVSLFLVLMLPFGSCYCLDAKRTCALICIIVLFITLMLIKYNIVIICSLVYSFHRGIRCFELFAHISTK